MEALFQRSSSLAWEVVQAGGSFTYVQLDLRLIYPNQAVPLCAVSALLPKQANPLFSVAEQILEVEDRG